MKGDYIKMPSTNEEWEKIAERFEKRWNFPHCVGVIDGIRVVMRCHKKSGSLNFNYKGTFSVVLMAVVDTDYKFICINVGSEGRHSDGGIFTACNFGKALTSGGLYLLKDATIPALEHHSKLPYVFVADEAFPLQTNLLHPYPGRNLSEENRIFNYRLSHARRVAENAFEILAAR